MIFHEIYGEYYNAVARALTETIRNKALGENQIKAIIEDVAFGESERTDNLTDGNWELIDNLGKTTLKYMPQMPLTTLQKRWLKSLLTDPRIKLFGVNSDGLEDVEPIYDYNDIVYFDQCLDGDPYEDEDYINNWRILYSASVKNSRIRVRMTNNRGTLTSLDCIPYRMEYSLRDDKFRCITAANNTVATINVARVIEIEVLNEHVDNMAIPERKTSEVVIILTDEHKALERAMLHFADYKKVTTRLDPSDNKYEIILSYDSSDMREVVNRILAFGSKVYVASDGPVRNRIIEKLKWQRDLQR